jgi:hypothetical protein
MQDSKKADPKKAGELAQQLVAILAKEDQDTQVRALQASMMLLGLSPGSHLNSKTQGVVSIPDDASNVDLATFFDRDEKLGPSDYAHLCAAYHFSRYGMETFSLDDIREIAKEAGVVLPDRLDMTLKAATKGGRRLFQVAGRGVFKPTVAASAVFKERWSVHPGKSPKTSVANRE